MATVKRTRKVKQASEVEHDVAIKQSSPAVQCVHCADQQIVDDAGKIVIQPHKKAILNRLSRIAGQVNGVSRMVEKDRYCIDILTQISAVRSALDAVSTQLLADHTNGCVRKAVLEDGGEDAITELLNIIKKMR
ncbi:hypothetical protein GCM10023206_22590 [Acinetobacter puyangensis]|uniref:DNA-binding transcriptional regulator, FrmR family n=1 Tax=Acinetobacter puyangensis TaxID=1096779 RepID=A0A240EDF2_9GAMM|nr:metal-sensitive transcriptional regulator [Acinetobacter puyangensis]SNX45935.1 DNA-binding transcriptional regulator, FrmR family [Acinetobacter puyangensis]